MKASEKGGQKRVNDEYVKGPEESSLSPEKGYPEKKVGKRTRYPHTGNTGEVVPLGDCCPNRRQLGGVEGETCSRGERKRKGKEGGGWGGGERKPRKRQVSRRKRTSSITGGEGEKRTTTVREKRTPKKEQVIGLEKRQHLDKDTTYPARQGES